MFCSSKTDSSSLRIADAEENLGESEVREAHLAKSLYFIRVGEKVGLAMFYNFICGVQKNCVLDIVVDTLLNHYFRKRPWISLKSLKEKL